MPYLKLRINQEIEHDSIKSNYSLPDMYKYLDRSITNGYDYYKKEIISETIINYNSYCAKCVTNLYVHLNEKIIQNHPEEIIAIKSKIFFKKYISDMSLYEYETFVLDIFSKYGYEVEFTKGSDDKGIDGIIYNSKDEKIIVQCKKYKKDNKIGPKFVRELIGAVVSENAIQGILVTTSGFSKKANIAAEESGGLIKLIDGEEFLELIVKKVTEEFYSENKRLIKGNVNYS